MFFQCRIQRHWKLNSKFVVACYRPTFLRYFHNNGFFSHKLLLIAICKLFGFRFLPQDTRRLHISMHCGIEQGNHGHVIETLCKNQSWHSIKLCSRPGLEDYVRLMLLGTLSIDNEMYDDDVRNPRRIGSRVSFLVEKRKVKQCVVLRRRRLLVRRLVALAMAFKNVRNLLLINHNDGFIDDEEFVLLYDLFVSKNLDFP